MNLRLSQVKHEACGQCGHSSVFSNKTHSGSYVISNMLKLIWVHHIGQRRHKTIVYSVIELLEAKTYIKLSKMLKVFPSH